MTKKSGLHELNAKIEELIEDHLAHLRREALATVQRAFGGQRRAPHQAVVRGGGWQRREPVVVAELAERFYESVCASPGETMAVLAKKLGASARQMHRPVANLKRAGRVRSVGEKQRTRYFPMAAGRSQA
jgi:predicted HTH transcriptional regulator